MSCAEDDSQDEAVDAEVETPSLFCGDREFIDPASGETLVRPETYYPRAIATALAAYQREPRASASSCVEARAQIAALDELHARDPDVLDQLGGLPEADDDVAPAQEDIEVSSSALRIWDGRDATTYATPVVTVQFLSLAAPGTRYRCTGFIVSPRHVLTAAHCAPGAGSKSVQWESIAGDSNAIFNVNVYIHPNFVGGAQTTPLAPAYDLALLEVPQRAETDIMDSSANRFRIHTGDTIIGQSLRLRGTGNIGYGAGEIKAPGLAQRPYQDQTAEISSHSGGLFRALAETSVRACRGDSGGPAVEIGNYTQPVVWGVFSGYSSNNSNLCPASGATMYWAKTSLARDWIEEKMKVLLGAAFQCARFGDAGKTYRRCW